MPPHITVLPASTVAGKATIRHLLGSDEKPHVRGIYRDTSKAPAEFTQNHRFEAAKGDVGAQDDLNFAPSSAVFYIPPPTYDGRDTSAFAAHAATNVQNALRRAGVRRLVLHSALGAQRDSGIVSLEETAAGGLVLTLGPLQGVLRLNHVSDEMLKAAAAEVVIVRPCNYFENWTSALKTMQKDPPTFESTFSPPDLELPLVGGPQTPPLAPQYGLKS